MLKVAFAFKVKHFALHCRMQYLMQCALFILANSTGLFHAYRKFCMHTDFYILKIVASMPFETESCFIDTFRAVKWSSFCLDRSSASMKSFAQFYLTTKALSSPWPRERHLWAGISIDAADGWGQLRCESCWRINHTSPSPAERWDSHGLLSLEVRWSLFPFPKHIIWRDYTK